MATPATSTGASTEQADLTMFGWLFDVESDPSSFVVFPEVNVEISFREAIATGRRVGALLLEAGIRPGDTVAAVLGNQPEFLGAWLGAMFANACFAPLNPDMPDIKLGELARSLEPAATFESGDGGVVIKTGGQTTAYDAAPRTDALCGTDLPAPGDIALMLFTGGTTGAPKGIFLSHRYVRVFAEYWMTSAKMRRSDVHLQDLPLHHANGLMGLIMALALHRRMFVYRRFSVSQYWSRVRESGATTTTWLGTMGHLVTTHVDASATTLERVKWVPRPPDVREIEQRLGLRVIESYGSTEGGMIAWTEPDSLEVGCGVIHAPYQITIESEDGLDVLTPGETGEIIVRCAEDWHMCSGYWRDGEVELHPTGLHEWRSGDLGELLEDDTFRVVGRAVGDIIRHKGENVSSREIEIAALQYRSVLEAAAVGVQSEFGSDIMLVCRPREGESVDPEEFSRFLADRLIKQARPRFLAFADELPKTVKQIVPKRELQHFKENAWDAEALRR